MKHHMVALLCLAAALPGCSRSPEEQVEAAVKDAILEQLKDPASAQFSDLRVVPGGLCGEVNAKNGFGGYVGRKPFFGTVDGSGRATAVIVEPGEQTPCDILNEIEAKFAAEGK